MSYYLCLGCGEIYNSDYLSTKYVNQCCPKASCIGPVVEIDELMLPIIKKLIDLGYSTRYCCSGHSFEHMIHSYLVLNEPFDIKLFESLPYSWGSEPFSDGYAIYPKNQDFNNSESLIDKQRQIFSIISDLMDWVENLPKATEMK